MAVKLGNGNWAVKEDKLLAYNDNSGRFFNKEFDFSRGSSATYVAKDGLIKSAASDVPRIDFSDTTNGALLLEPQSTNLIENSEPITYSVKGGAEVTFTPYNWDIGFDTSVNYGDNSVTRYMYFPCLNSTQYTISFFIRMDDLSKPDFSTITSSGDLTLDNKTSLGTVKYIELINNIWRIEVPFISGSTFPLVGLRKYTGQSAKTFKITGIQLEQNSFATSYIPTSGAISTRSADVCNNSGSAQDFNSEEGVLYAEISALTDTDTTNPNRGISISSGSTNNTIFIYYQSALNGLACILISNGTTQFSHSTPLFDVDDYLKIALKYKQNDFALWVNGTEIATDTSGNAPIGLNELAFDNGVGNDKFYGKVKCVAVFTEALTDEELTCLTTI